MQVVILLLIGVSLHIGGADGPPLVIKGEPRGSIISFLVATICVNFQIEWITELHVKAFHVKTEGTECKDPIAFALRFRTASKSLKSCRSPAMAKLTVGFFWALTLGLFLAGSLSEVITFTSFLGNSSCVQSYNLYTLGTELVAASSLQGNSVKPQVWTLFMGYLLLAIVLPLVVHSVHGLVFVLDLKTEKLCRLANVGWTFASAEVLVLALLVLQVRFSIFGCRSIECLVLHHRSNSFPLTWHGSTSSMTWLQRWPVLVALELSA